MEASNVIVCLKYAVYERKIVYYFLYENVMYKYSIESTSPRRQHHGILFLLEAYCLITHVFVTVSFTLFYLFTEVEKVNHVLIMIPLLIYVNSPDVYINLEKTLHSETSKIIYLV